LTGRGSLTNFFGEVDDQPGVFDAKKGPCGYLPCYSDSLADGAELLPEHRRELRFDPETRENALQRKLSRGAGVVVVL
jgi:hypothetical protein